jgi:hypothetical protein
MMKKYYYLYRVFFAFSPHKLPVLEQLTMQLQEPHQVLSFQDHIAYKTANSYVSYKEDTGSFCVDTTQRRENNATVDAFSHQSKIFSLVMPNR